LHDAIVLILWLFIVIFSVCIDSVAALAVPQAVIAITKRREVVLVVFFVIICSVNLFWWSITVYANIC